jgi:hypothetical protein
LLDFNNGAFREGNSRDGLTGTAMGFFTDDVDKYQHTRGVESGYSRGGAPVGGAKFVPKDGNKR